MLNLHVTYLDIDTLKPYPGNPRKHSEKQLHQIGRSINRYGFIVPALVDGNNVIIVGQARVEAARRNGVKEVPVIYMTHLTPAQIREYRIADNKLAELSDWNKETLKLEFEGLLEFDSSLDLTVTGFEMAEIDLTLQGTAPEKDSVDDISGLLKPEPVSRLGDLWSLGDHKILCGNALNLDDYKTLMADTKALMCFTDSPYNVPVNGHISGKGKAKHGEFAMASGEMTREQFIEFLHTSCANIAAFTTNGSISFMAMDWRHIEELITAARDVFTELKNICVWIKDNGGMGSLYRSQHEFIAVFKNGTEKHVNNVELGKHGRYRTNAWQYAGQNTFHAGRKDDLAAHPTVKPVQMVADAILDCSTRGSIILDPFGGSGTTLLAAEKTGRRARLIELEPQYVDVTIRRWQQLTGHDAVHATSEKTFNKIEKEMNDGK